MAERYTPEQLDRIERMLDLALLEVDLYKQAWHEEQRLKWALAERVLDAAKERDELLVKRRVKV
jgi:hypothetical protein